MRYVLLMICLLCAPLGAQAGERDIAAADQYYANAVALLRGGDFASAQWQVVDMIKAWGLTPDQEAGLRQDIADMPDETRMHFLLSRHLTMRQAPAPVAPVRSAPKQTATVSEPVNWQPYMEAVAMLLLFALTVWQRQAVYAGMRAVGGFPWLRIVQGSYWSLRLGVLVGALVWGVVMRDQIVAYAADQLGHQMRLIADNTANGLLRKVGFGAGE